MSKRFQGSGKDREGGLGAVHRHDFAVHTTGDDWRHTADQTDMNPQITDLGGSIQDKTVQGTLEKISTFLTTVGQGFISIGDGYDQRSADFTIGDPGTPTLRDAFNAAFVHPRIVNGGIILVKAGVYALDSTVTVPAGITIMGEIAGTTIKGETGEVPMFIISRSVNRPKIGPVDNIDSTEPIDRNVIFNITLADNLDGYALAGAPTMTSTPMIQVERGGSLVCDQVSFFGRMAGLETGVSFFNRDKTMAAVGTTTGSSSDTKIIIKNCVADGLRNFIQFRPGGTGDLLIVDKCKARAFGIENFTVNKQNDTFIDIQTSGEVKITNNFFTTPNLGTYSNVSSLAVVSSGSPSVIVTSNSGSIPGDTTGNASLVVPLNSTINFTGAILANNFDSKHGGTEWFLTAGDGVSSVGDITGINAINTWSNLEYSNNGTLIIGAGTYTVNVASAASVGTLIGHSSTSRPIVNLSLTAGTLDGLGNRFLTASSVKNIEFRNTGTVFQSISSGLDYGVIECFNCKFNNISLLVQASSNTDAIVNVYNCVFTQTGVFSDNLSCYIHPVSIVRLDSCVFRGNGYALAITQDIGSDTESNPIDTTVSNTTFNIVGETITGNSPLGTSRNRYVVIYDFTVSGKVKVESCTIYASDDAVAPTPIDAGLVSTFTKFVEISAEDVTITNCDITGPNQTYTSSNDFAIPTVFVEPGKSFFFTNNKVMGALPLQISGPIAFSNVTFETSDHDLFGAVIKDSMLSGYRNNNVTGTVLDIDLDFNGSEVGGAFLTEVLLPKIIVHGCTCSNAAERNALAPFQTAEHVNIVGSNYETSGVVQIYANGYDIKVSDCYITGTLNLGSGFLATADHRAGLYVNAFDTPVSSDGQPSSSVMVSNNTIRIRNSYTTGTSTDFASGLSVKSRRTIIADNFVEFNSTTLATSKQVVLVVNNPTGALGAIDAVVTGNSLARGGTTVALSTADHYVYIESGSVAGVLTHNSFDWQNADGSSASSSINDNTNTWIVAYNKNQEEIITLPNSSTDGRVYGHFGTGVGASGSIILGGASASDSDVRAGNTTNSLLFFYPTADIGSEILFAWLLPFEEILPANAKIISISVDVTANALFDTTGDFEIKLLTQSGTDATSGVQDFTSGALSRTITVTPGNPNIFRTYVDFPMMKLTLVAEDSGALRTITFDEVRITYRY